MHDDILNSLTPNEPVASKSGNVILLTPEGITLSKGLVELQGGDLLSLTEVDTPSYPSSKYEGIFVWIEGQDYIPIEDLISIYVSSVRGGRRN